MVCPLNWGLGHATRCMPLIDFWLNRNCTITIASDGIALQLLKKEYPELQFYELPSYHIQYQESNMYMNMLRLLPKIESGIRREKQSIQSILDETGAKVIVSDHRFGCRNSKVPSYLIAHQLQIPARYLIARKLVTGINKKYINRFDECWIPDFEGEDSLAGKISSSKGINQYRHIGPLSRFNKNSSENRWDIAIILSGPEPARTVFENFLLENIEQNDLKIIFVRGALEKSQNLKLNRYQTKDLLTSKKLTRKQQLFL